jgi:hypothetical protein
MGEQSWQSWLKGLAKELALNLGGIWLALIPFAFFAVLAIAGNNYGWWATSEGNAPRYVKTEFEAKVKTSGETVFTSVEAGSEELTEELEEKLMGKTFLSPDAAEYAATEAIDRPETLPWTWIYHQIGTRPAYAHAVKICTHNRDGVVSRNTGAGRHVTWFIKHDNGRHFTRTDHQILTQYGYQTYATYRYDVSRSYCGCW